METKKLVLMALGIKGFFVLMVAILLVANHYMVAGRVINRLATPDEIKTELQKGEINVNAYDEDNGITALMYTAHAGNLDAVKLLLDNGAKVNLQAKQAPFIPVYAIGNTALMYAAESSDVTFMGPEEDVENVITLLLKKGADPNKPNSDKRTTAHYLLKGTSVLERRMQLLQELLKYRLKVNVQDLDGDTMLHLAAQNNEGEWLAMLFGDPKYNDVAKLFNPYIKNNTGFNFMEEAMFFGNGDLLTKLRSAIEKNDALSDTVKNAFLAEIVRVQNVGLDIKPPEGKSSIKLIKEKMSSSAIQKMPVQQLG